MNPSETAPTAVAPRDEWPARVVIVDDDWSDGIIDAIRDGLALLGIHVDAYTSADDGLAGVLSDPEPPVVIMDHNLGPGADGYEVVRGIREQHPFGLLIPVIYFSAYERLEGFAEKQRGRDGLLFSPNAWVGKNAGNPSLLEHAVVSGQDMINQLRNLATKQALRQSLLAPPADFPGTDWTSGADPGDDPAWEDFDEEDGL